MPGGGTPEDENPLHWREGVKELYYKPSEGPLTIFSHVQGCRGGLSRVGETHPKG